MPIAAKQLKRFWNPVFIETGTYMGAGVEGAIKAEFPLIISLDICEKFVREQSGRFHNSLSTIKIIQKDSGSDLWDIISSIDSCITFWLDAHDMGEKWSFGQQTHSDVLCPVLKELDQIGRHHRNDHVILIDDMRCFDDGIWGSIGREDILHRVRAINGEYDVSFIDGCVAKDILVAQKRISNVQL